MILNTDKQKTSLKGVYVFYSVIITLCILALFVFNLNIYAKAVLCTLVLLCVLVMRSLKHAVPMPPDIDTETITETILIIIVGGKFCPIIRIADAPASIFVDVPQSHFVTILPNQWKY